MEELAAIGRSLPIIHTLKLVTQKWANSWCDSVVFCSPYLAVGFLKIWDKKMAIMFDGLDL